VLFCCAGCGEETCRGEGLTGAGMALKHAGFHGKEFILLLVVLVSIVLQHLVSVTLNLVSVAPNLVSVAPNLVSVAPNLVSVAPNLVSVTPNKPMFFKKKNLNNFITFHLLPKGQVHTIM
jgi:hypothetical protein